MKFLQKLFGNGIGYIVLFLLIFIPLYPKLPLIDIKNTWVYVRAEDFVVFFTLIIWAVLLIKRKVSLKTPLTIPILAFWIIGAIATIHGVVVIFPTIADVFPNVALLSYIRHLEYLSLFFVAFSAVKSKKYVLAGIWTMVATLLGVIFYGFGQRLLSFPAYLTMNEEYAKGIPIIISPLNRVSSTFAGHYDLAAYLVFVVPIVVSLAFGFRNIFVKIALLSVALLGCGLMVMTVSRVSFFALAAALFIVIFFHSRKILLYIIPVIIVAGFAFLYTQSSLLSRFGNTVNEVEVLVDAATGADIGQVKFQSREYLYDKNLVNEGKLEVEDPQKIQAQINYARQNGIPLHLSSYLLPMQVAIVEAEITSTGETLPQGTSYINLSLSPVTQRLDTYYFELPVEESSTSATVRVRQGEYLVKRASAYDLSFTTRFQGEWPHALLAFSRNLFFGSGYGSVSLAVDNNYYRMLGETGLFGTAAFITIFLVLGSYIKKVLPKVESKAVRGLVLGFVAGVIGLFLNATLIDVFEASKVAFVLWLTTGIVVGGLALYQSEKFNPYREVAKLLVSPIALIIYLLLITITIFSTTISSYFIGDDFTWLKWASECIESGCSYPQKILGYFFDSEGFFYRPGTKTYFLLMYPVFWLNQVVYHIVSIILHFIVVILLYLLARKIFSNGLLAAFAAFIFLIISGYLEIVLWISGTGHLLNAIFIILSLLSFIKWHESKRKVYFIASIFSALVSLMFHELGIVTPFLAITYVLFKSDFGFKSMLKASFQKSHILLFVPLVTYLFVRLLSHTYWFSGDYSYNIVKFPLNAVGNIFGYLLITIFGPLSYPLYEGVRGASRSNIPISLVGFITVGLILYFLGRALLTRVSVDEKKIVLFSSLFFVFSLLPFLGLGNISFRYSYLASFGVIIIGVLLVNKLYVNLKSSGKDIAFGVTAALISIFCLVHIVQAQQVIIDWGSAGEKVERFLISLDSLYQDSWSNRSVDLYFAKVPIKNNSAWVLPVGLKDAVWFAFKNENIHVYQIESLEEVGYETFTAKDKWVFEFQSDGSLKRINVEDVYGKENN